ncbi:hypothetical protein [Erythrobacter sp. MTPC3]|uniref:hypothetical protein n=1 Tax=Erythrobacter sp. MTPC3 TaxID=3056564 RepID=UPI0036F35176
MNTQSLESWEQLRDDSDIQFEEIEIPAPEVQEPSWFLKMLQAFFDFLGEVLSPIGGFIVSIWPVLQWVLLALLAALVLYLVARTFGPLASLRKSREQADEEPVWQPDQAESLALLEDADRLAAEGRYDEATHLLLKRSVAQIASSRPDWVEPSSTARELSALPALSDAARGAFATMTERVERSLFALRALDASDWEAARGAYAEFALVKIGKSA